MGVKFRVNQNLFSRWSRGMAYVLGFFCADGCMIDGSAMRGKYIIFYNTDREILEKIKIVLDAEHKIYERKDTAMSTKRKRYYMLKIGNHKLYNDLLLLGITPNKSLNLQMPPVPNNFFNAFVRGYLDGDWCLHK